MCIFKRKIIYEDWMRVFFISMIFFASSTSTHFNQFYVQKPPIGIHKIIWDESLRGHILVTNSTLKKRNPCILLVNIYLVYIPRFKKYFCSQCFLDIIGMQINKLVINNKSCWHNQKPGILGVILNPSRRSIKMHSIVWPVSAFK